MVVACKILTQKQFQLWQCDKVGVLVHWVMYKNMDFQPEPNGMNTHQKKLVNDSTNILWDFCVQSNRKLEHNKPDIIVAKETGECHIMVVLFPFITPVKNLFFTEKVEPY